MTDRSAAQAFAALGNPTRLAVLRLLVQAAPDGLSVGDLQRLADVPASTLAHHLAALAGVGIIHQEKQGRSIINRVRFNHIQDLSDHLLENCCKGLSVGDDAAA